MTQPASVAIVGDRSSRTPRCPLSPMVTRPPQTSPTNTCPHIMPSNYKIPSNEGPEGMGDRQQTLPLRPSPYPLNPPPPPPLPPEQQHRTEGPVSATLPRVGDMQSTTTIVERSSRGLKEGKKEELTLRAEFTDLCEAFGIQRRDYAAQRREFAKEAAMLSKLSPNKRANPQRYRPPGHWDNLQRSLDRVNLVDQNCQARERELDILEQKLKQKEAQIYQQQEQDPPSILSFPDLVDHIPISEDDDTNSTISSTNPLVNRYYDRIGDIHLLRERLFNFEAEHRRQLAVRTALWKSRHNVETPDPVFFETYFRGREKFIREYSDANQEVQQLRSQCRDQGLEVEEPNLPPFNEAQALDQSRRDEKSIAYVNPASVDGSASIATDLLAVDIESKARVVAWLGGIEKEGPAPLQHTKVSDSNVGESTAGISTSDPSPHEKGPTEEALPLLATLSPQNVQAELWDKEHNIVDDMDEVVRKLFPDFQGDPPRRRYSEPDMRSIHYPHQTGDLDILDKTRRKVKGSKSVR